VYYTYVCIMPLVRFTDAPDEKLSPLVIQSLKEFHHHNKLKDVVLKNLASKIVSKQEQVLQICYVQIIESI